jgi:hypothetical protein
MTLVERLKRRADELEAMIEQPQAETAAAWAVQAHCCMGKARLDHLAAIAEIERLENALETAREALEPFGNSDMRHAVETGHRESEDSVVTGICDFTIGDLLRANSAIRTLSQKKEG